MSRFIPNFPVSFSFCTSIPVRITDINYGGHVGNDKILSIIHEARVLYLDKLEMGELNFGGGGLIMKTVAIDFIKELFYGDMLQVSVTAGEFSTVAFSLFYKLERTNGDVAIIAQAKTGMVCYDYEKRKVSVLKAETRQQLI